MNKPLLFAVVSSRLLAAALFLSPLVLTGCLNAQMQDKIQAREPEVASNVAKASAPAAQLDYNPLVVTDKVWTGGRSIRMRHGLPLPVIYEGPRSMTLVSSKSMALTDIASFVHQQTGIPVRLTDGAENARPGPLGGGAAGANASGGAAASAIPSAGIPIGGAPSSSDDVAEKSVDGMKVSYQGTLSGFLDNISSYYGVSWRYDGTAIIVSRYETRTFVIEAMSGSSTFSDGISGGGGGSSGGSGGGGGSTIAGSLDSQSKMDGKIDSWAELQETVNTILAGVGTVKAAPSSGTVTVITTPEIMRSVAQFIEQENARSTRQVAVTIELFTLSLDDSENITTNVNLIYKNLGYSQGIGGISALTPTAEAGNTFGVNIISPTSKWNGSRALIQALSSLGKVSRVARFPLTTLNNRPTTRRIGRDITYVAQRSTTTTSGTDSASETITPGTVGEGFQLQVTPRILGDGRIIVQMSLSVTDLIQLKEFGKGTDSEIQLPETANRIFVQQALLQNGDTLVLAGFDQDQQSATNTGMLNPFNILFGGTVAAADTRELLFLTVTPREIDVPGRQMISNGSLN